jgi:hypothetical protein
LPEAHHSNLNTFDAIRARSVPVKQYSASQFRCCAFAT